MKKKKEKSIPLPLIYVNYISKPTFQSWVAQCQTGPFCTLAYIQPQPLFEQRFLSASQNLFAARARP